MITLTRAAHPVRRSHLVLDNFNLHPVSERLVTILDLGCTADIDPDGSVEFQGVSAGCRLGITEHDTDFLAELVDEDAAGIRLRDVGGQFA